ncbi:MAG: cytochrome c [Rhodobacteraceae bacterium]|nr:cytochrome c [Paracoccaceae bacterium]
MRGWTILAGSGAIIVAAALLLWPGPPATDLDSAALVQLVMPDSLSEHEQLGAALYAENCAVCHGVNGAGVAETGPPLVHIIYETSHHPDGAFYAAVQLGVRAHHWGYGDMPRLPHLSEQEIAQIIAFIRRVQRENGIF